MHYKIFSRMVSMMLLVFSTQFAYGTTTFTFQFGGGNPCAPAEVNFFPQTDIANPIYAWTVNSITFSNQVEPTRIFPAGGTYNVCLTVSNGTVTPEIHCETIEVFNLPTVTLSNAVTLGCDPLEVEYVLTSTSPIDSVSWDFGDGTVVNENGNDGNSMTYTHFYLSAGTFTPIVTVFDENGCKVTVQNPGAVQVISTPTPSFTSNESIGCTAPHVVSFNNNTITNPNISFEWNFGDPGIPNSTALNPTVTYANLGAYDVTLFVTDNVTGCMDTLLVEDFINVGEFAGFQFSYIEDGDCDVTEVGFSFFNSGNVQNVEWLFGDGSTSTDLNPIHSYTTQGCYTPTLKIWTTDGCFYEKVSDDCIESNGPVATTYTSNGDLITCDPVNGTTVSFQGVSAQATEYAWNFGDGNTSTQQNPTHTFTNAGYYPVALEVTYPDGCTESIVNDTIVIQEIFVDFDVDVFEGCEDLTVNFTDLTNQIDPIASWSWDFGGVGTSTDQNPTFTFVDTGSYDIELTIVTTTGCTSVLLIEDYIKVGMKPVSDFEATPLVVCLDDEVEFTSLASPITNEWDWYFGDGGQSSEENPTHEYTDTGFFDVMLIALHNGCPDTLIVEKYIYVSPPKADFTVNQDCSNPGEVQFFDESVGADSWTWDFGDGPGSTSTNPNPAYTYSANGSYIVTLTVSNSTTGCTHTESATVNVTTAAPEFSLYPLDICVGDTVYVTNNSVGADCYVWSFPWGVGMITTSVCDDAPSFYFPVSGKYSGFSLTITDASGCVNTYEFPDTITVTSTTSNFGVNKKYGCAPHFVNFQSYAITTNSQITNYYWDLGDGATSTSSNPIHQYTEPGVYPVSLTVTNADGCSDSLWMDSVVIVDNVEPFFIPQVTDCSTQAVDFVNSSTSVLDDLTYLWNFGDGNTSTDVNPSHTYATSGNYTVCLTAENSWGCDEIFCDNINFSSVTVDFVADNTYKSCPEPPLLSCFTDLSAGAVSWSWDFGDGAISTLQSPCHSYNQVGKYDVCLTVTNSLGCVATECKVEYIEVAGPSGVVIADPVGGCADHDVTFIINSENAYKYIWDFGDGFVEDTLANGNTDTIHHTYTSAGTFNPVVLVEDASGCQVAVLSEPIVVEDLISDFSVTASDICEGNINSVDFDVTFNDPSIITSVSWEFPGGTPATSNAPAPTGVIYEGEGYFSVILHVTTSFCQTTVTKDSFILVHPEADVDFTVTPSAACTNQPISFEDISTMPMNIDSIVSWNWSVDGTTYTTPTFSHEFATAGDYTVILETTSSFGCVSNASQTVTIYESLPLDAGSDQFLCQGDVASLNADVGTATGATFSWSPSTGLTCDDCPNPDANPPSTTLYYVTATSVNGCISVDSVEVEVSQLPAPVVQITPTSTICEGDELQLEASITQTATSYEWDTDQPGLSCYDCPNPIATPTDTTTYSVTIYTPEGCKGSATVLVNVIPFVDLVDGDKVICNGGFVVLETPVGDNFFWQPNDGSLNCTDCPHPIATPTETTTYTVTALIAGQCQVVDEVTVFVMQPEDVFAGDDQSICAGVTTTLNGFYPGDYAVWLENGDTIAVNTPTPEVTPDHSTYYVLVVTANDNCVLTDTVAVEVKDKVSIFGEDVTICQGENVQLEMTGDAETYTWSPSTGLSATNIPNPFASPDESMTYMVIGEFGQCEPDTHLLEVTVIENPNIGMPSISYFSDGQSINLDAQATGGGGNNTYHWTPPANLSCTDCPDPIASPVDDIDYYLTVTDEFGCSDSSMIRLQKIYVCNEDLIVVPNAFTPNGDGLNDEFIVRGSLEISLTRIYNRWGEIIFESTGAGPSWDGTYKGQKLNRDVFVYYIEAKCGFNDDTVVKTGDITLIR